VNRFSHYRARSTRTDRNWSSSRSSNLTGREKKNRWKMLWWNWGGNLRLERKN